MKLQQRCISQSLALVSFTWLVLALLGCKTQPVSPPLQAGDRIEVCLTETPMNIAPVQVDLSDKGTIRLAYIDHPVHATGKTPAQLARILHDLYVPKVFNRVHVSVIPLKVIYASPPILIPPPIDLRTLPATKYFYVGGQIGSGKDETRIAYLGRTTILTAIAAAGGFNDSAAKNRVRLTRADGATQIVDCLKAVDDPKLDLEVFPGDRVFVDRVPFPVGLGPQ
jgi:protein involved in polysaccharide export with SLBB domain